MGLCKMHIDSKISINISIYIQGRAENLGENQEFHKRGDDQWRQDQCFEFSKGLEECIPMILLILNELITLNGSICSCCSLSPSLN